MSIRVPPPSTDPALRPPGRPTATPPASYPPIAREGWIIVAVFVLATAALTALAVRFLGPGGWAVGAAGLALSLWSVWFFRDPDRAAPASGPGDGGVVISPADGVVVAIARIPPPAELAIPEPEAGAMTRVSIFMNVFNVHVNRSPADGTIERIHYRPGKFFNASLDKASEQNERCSFRLRLPDGRAMAFVQIAGLIARRIVCNTTESAEVRAGQRFGLIRFGSRVDVYLPGGAEPVVALGQATVAGVTVLARLGPPGRGAGVATTAAGARAGAAGKGA